MNRRLSQSRLFYRTSLAISGSHSKKSVNVLQGLHARIAKPSCCACRKGALFALSRKQRPLLARQVPNPEAIRVDSGKLASCLK